MLCMGNGLGRFSSNLLVLFGLLSLAVAAVFILRQRDYKRLLAYSSIEHLGIIALGIGLGGVGVFGAALHAVGHSLTKGAMFMITGNIFEAFDSKFVADVRGLRRALPGTGLLWLAGFLSITGCPPFSTFLSELMVLKAAIDGRYYLVAALYLGALALIFIGMVNHVIPMAQGTPPALPGDRHRREPLWSIGPSAVLLGLVLVLGLWLARPIEQVLENVSASLQAPASDVADRPPSAPPGRPQFVQRDVDVEGEHP
jgi:hydrogenase-4 component F